jgi:hypothetical protein
MQGTKSPSFGSSTLRRFTNGVGFSDILISKLPYLCDEICVKGLRVLCAMCAYFAFSLKALIGAALVLTGRKIKIKLVLCRRVYDQQKD